MFVPLDLRFKNFPSFFRFKFFKRSSFTFFEFVCAPLESGLMYRCHHYATLDS